MLKALAWKEWRTQRSLVFAGWGLAAIMPLFMMAGMMASSSNYRFEDLIAAMTPVFTAGIWPLFAAATAGSAFASDMSDDSLKFLLSRPVSRARVWLVKVGAALMAFLAVVIGTTLIGFLYALLSVDDRGSLVRSLIDGIPPFELETLTGIVVLTLPFAFLFGCSLYCSTFVKRPMAAALGGFLVAAGMSIPVALVWSLFVPFFSLRVVPAVYGGGMVAGVPLGTIGIFIAAYWVFRRGDIFAGDGRKRALRPLLIITVVVAGISVVPSAYFGVQAMASISADYVGNVTPIEGALILAERTPGGFSTRIARIPVDGGASSLVVPEHATGPVASPDGNWVVYVAQGGYFGRSSGEIELRAVRADGSEDHSISASLGSALRWDWGYRTFSVLIAPDNDHVVYVSYGDVIITSISGGEARMVDLGMFEDIGVIARLGGVIGWMAGPSTELLYYRVVNRLRGNQPEGRSTELGSAMRKTELRAFDPTTGESRLVREFPGNHRLSIRGTRFGRFGATPMRSWALLPAWIEDADGEHLYLIDTASGELLELSGAPCDYWGFSADNRQFLYGNCSGTLRFGDAHAELRIRDLVTGADEPFAVLEGYDQASAGRELFLSPDGERILMYSRAGYGASFGTYLVSRGGDVRPLAEHLMPAAWINDREALMLRDYGYPRFLLNVVDLETGRTRSIFPRQ